MKLTRQKELLRFFQWLAGLSARDLPDSLLGLMLLYALHADSDLDATKIYHTLSSNPELKRNAMSIAEKLKAEGREEGLVAGQKKGLEKGLVEGQKKGLWIGKIQAFEEFLEQVLTPRELLETLPLEELEARHQKLHRAYELRFKRS